MLAQAAPGEETALASITVSELLAGVHHADTEERRVRRAAFVDVILRALPILPFALAEARVHADIHARLASEGRIIGPHDLIIAATALANDYAVLTENVREFERVPGLVVQRPAW